VQKKRVMSATTTSSRVPQYQVDAFARRRYCGNPAAVVLLQSRANWPLDSVLLDIARENNLSETAFVLEPEETYDAEDGPSRANTETWFLRWFTPGGEVDLCGHATLAAGHVLFQKVPSMIAADEITFVTKSGELYVQRVPCPVVETTQEQPYFYTMEFPAVPTSPLEPESREEVETQIKGIFSLTGSKNVRVMKGGPDLMLVVEHSGIVEAVEPDQMALKVLLVKHKFRGCIITSCYNAGIGCADPLVAAGQKQGGAAENEPKLDFVSRFFAPNLGIPEDPVTGSAHCCLALYWAEEFELEGIMTTAPSKKLAELHAKQISRRGGYVDIALHTNADGKLVCKLTGQCVDFLDGIIILEE